MAKTTQDDNKQAGVVIAPRPALSKDVVMLGKIGAWITANIALPILYKFAEWYSNRPKFVDSAKPDDEDKKAIEKAKQDGWE
jgi:hypothetical protein